MYIFVPSDEKVMPLESAACEATDLNLMVLEAVDTLFATTPCESAA